MLDTALRAAALRLPQLKLLLFGVVALTSVGVGFLSFDVSQAKDFVQRFGYYTISLTFAWAIIAVGQVSRVLWSQMAIPSHKEWRQAVGIIVSCALVAGFTVPINYKVLYDEMVLQATAWNLHFFREVSTIVRGYVVDGVFAPFDTYLDKRPFFFAYILSLLHDLTGYREANAFRLNLMLMPVLLVQVYLLARRFSRHAAAISAVVVLGTFSLLAHNATGAGMELLNSVMLLLAIHLSVIYLDAPDERRLSALVLVTVLLAQTRYESSLYAAPVALVMLEGWRRAQTLILPMAVILGPALLIPYALHNTYLSGTPMLWELTENADARFSARHFLPNLEHAVSFFFNFSSRLTNSWWLAGVGMIALVATSVMFFRHRAQWRQLPSAVVVLIGFGGAITANLLLLMFYYWGQLDDPIVGRLSLPFSLLLAFAIAHGVEMAGVWRRSAVRVVIGGALLAYISNGLAANALHTGLNTLEHELTWEHRMVEARPPGERLIITNKSSLPWMLRHTPAILIAHARRRVEAVRYHLERETFREILVLQTYRPIGRDGGFQLLPSDRLPDSFVLEPVGERRFGARLLRVSRLVKLLPSGEIAAGNPAMKE